MRQGKAPIGIDGKKVNLHHIKGKRVDLYDYIEITHTKHYTEFKELHKFLWTKK